MLSNLFLLLLISVVLCSELRQRDEDDIISWLPFSDLLLCLKSIVIDKIGNQNNVFRTSSANTARISLSFKTLLDKAFQLDNGRRSDLVIQRSQSLFKCSNLHSLDYFVLEDEIIGHYGLDHRPFQMPFNGRFLGELSLRIKDRDTMFLYFLRAHTPKDLPTHKQVRKNLYCLGIDYSMLSFYEEKLYNDSQDIKTLVESPEEHVLLQHTLCVTFNKQFLTTDYALVQFLNLVKAHHSFLRVLPEKCERAMLAARDKHVDIVIRNLPKVGELVKKGNLIYSGYLVDKNKDMKRKQGQFYDYWDHPGIQSYAGCWYLVLWSKAPQVPFRCSLDTLEKEPLILTYPLDFNDSKSMLNLAWKLIRHGDFEYDENDSKLIDRNDLMSKLSKILLKEEEYGSSKTDTELDKLIEKTMSLIFK